jgi:hypothetical protein
MVRFHPDFSTMNHADRSQPHFYFSLPRLLVLHLGGDPARSENNGTEAWLAGVTIYLINCLFFAQLFPPALNFWQSAFCLLALALVIVPFWLLVLYLNSVVIKFLRLCGIFRTIPTRRAQSILLGFLTTAMAVDLARRGAWAGEIAAVWLIAVAMNLAAAAILAFRNGVRPE